MRNRASSEKDAESASETRVIDSFCEFLTAKFGSVTKAWRCTLDINRNGSLLFPEFIDALTRVNWHGDASALWSALLGRALRNSDDPAVGLRELSPEDSCCLEGFKDWACQQFGGTVAMFRALNSEPNGSLTLKEFEDACAKHGYSGIPSAIFYGILDLDGVGSISLQDMAVLESDALLRELTLNPVFEMGLEAAKASARQRRNRDLLHCQARKNALREFRSRVRAVSGGSFIRGWRSILDQNGNLAVSNIELLKGCRKIGFRGNVVALWKAMDVDDDGTALLREVDVRMAMVLAMFKKWAAEKYGCCIAALEQLAATARQKSATYSVEEFTSALCLANFPRIPGLMSKQAALMLHEAFDLAGTGSISSQNVAFLDRWEPSPWLCADPDAEGRDRLIALLRSRYSNLIVAWRRLFDHDNTNRVSYKDFSAACRGLRIQNVPGIWRALDRDMSGFISLHMIDLGSADVLQNFKEWAEMTFGTIQYAFRAMDSSGSNALSLPAFKRTLQNFGYAADGRVLFQSLKPESSGRQGGRDPRLTLADLRYLSFWRCSGGSDSLAEEDWQEHALGEPPRASLRLRRRRTESGPPAIAQPPLSRHSPRLLRRERSVGSCVARVEPRARRIETTRVTYPRMSEQFWYCKTPCEHKALMWSRSMFELPAIRHVTNPAEGLPLVDVGCSSSTCTPTVGVMAAVLPTRTLACHH
mmetsp:Transcript_45527/g.145172  ORF Transcript_45527/g.145172 Transcript_45527/m.145172 type:complete len:702 (+) Transcript_45527:86-2191(+)